MCGLYAQFLKESHVNIHSCRNALDTMEARGPDSSDEVILKENHLYMGHRRLAIQDLSDAGNQPMLSRSARYTIIYNGEIYNHLELRNKLQNDSSNTIYWNGDSDTETALAVIDKYGFNKAIEFFHGMFAICLYDHKKNCILLARDRLGEKPLYYGIRKNILEISSTLNFLNTPSEKEITRLSKRAINAYLHSTFIPHSYCIYKDFEKVPPGHIIKIDLETLSSSKFQYWDLINISSKSHGTSNIEDIENALSIAVKNQLISDRPIGCFLSGGIDSSLISALASQKIDSGKLKTFTIGYEDGAYSEAIYAERVAEYLNTEHKTLIVKPELIIDAVQNISKIYDEPFADYSQIPTFLLSKLTSEHVTVALSGDGGDELFGGYNRYKYYKYVKSASRLPPSVKKLINKIFQQRNTATLDWIFKNLIRIDSPGIKIQKASQALLSKDSLEYYLSSTNHGITNNKKMFGDFKRLDLIKYHELLKDYQDEEKLMLLDLIEYLPNDILVKVDRASMANSLECRAPFLDPNVVKTALTLPLDFKIKNGESKWILKEILGKYLPKELYERPKMGFGFPLDSWLRTDLKEWAEHILLNNSIEEINPAIDNKYIKNIWKQHLSGQNKFSEIWTLIILKSWLHK